MVHVFMCVCAFSSVYDRLITDTMMLCGHTSGYVPLNGGIRPAVSLTHPFILRQHNTCVCMYVCTLDITMSPSKNSSVSFTVN